MKSILKPQKVSASPAEELAQLVAKVFPSIAPAKARRLVRKIENTISQMFGTTKELRESRRATKHWRAGKPARSCFRYCDKGILDELGNFLQFLGGGSSTRARGSIKRALLESSAVEPMGSEVSRAFTVFQRIELVGQ